MLPLHPSIYSDNMMYSANPECESEDLSGKKKNEKQPRSSLLFYHSTILHWGRSDFLSIMEEAELHTQHQAFFEYSKMQSKVTLGHEEGKTERLKGLMC